jgi:vitamin K-dependent gamma-carboxylase-like protein
MARTSVTDRAFEPVDAASLAVFRIAFGALMFVEILRYFTHGWIARYYITPSFHFSYFGFGWIHPWPAAGMHWHFAALGILTVLIAAGFAYETATALFCAGFTFVFLLDEARYLNHFYLICLLSFLLALVPAHRLWSLDARRRPDLRSSVVPAWALWLIRFQVAVPYFYAGVAKLNDDWLAGSPLRQWLASRSDIPIIGPFFNHETIVWFFTYASLAFDLLVVPFLLWRRTRPIAFLVAVLFHAVNSQLFNIGIFPPLMIAATTVFFDPDWPRTLWRRIRMAADRRSAAMPAASTWWSRDRWQLGWVACYVVLQLILPLRHFLYPGNVNWTEEGHRFSWHMKLRDKQGDVRFTARNGTTGSEWSVDPHAYLVDWQVEEMSTRPDMIQQLCHRIAEDAAAAGEPVQVRVSAMVSLNDRPLQLLIDPSVDLAGEARSLWPARWIVPLEDRTPPLAER